MEAEQKAETSLANRAISAGFWVILLGSRILARQKSLWEWDDHIFGLALRNFKPLQGVPHPPFYPAYIFAARMLRPLVGGEVPALTWLSVISSGAALVFLYRILRELSFERRVAGAATALFAFFPAVWLHAGVPLSDPFGMALAYLALWLGLRSLSRPDFGIVAAGLAFGLALAARPQTALIALPAIVAAGWKNRGIRAWCAAGGGEFLFFSAFVLPVVRACHGLALALSLLRIQGHYVVTTDSRFGDNFDTAYMAGRYLIDIWGNDVLALAVTTLASSGLALLALERRRRALCWLFASFVPYLVVCWTFLDPHVAGRYAMPYLPLVAVPLALLFDRLEKRFDLAIPVLSAATVVFSAAVVAPAIRLIDTRLSPPEEAADEIRREAGGRPFSVFFSPAMVLPTDYYFPDATRLSQEDVERATPAALARQPVWEYRLREIDDGADFSAWPDLPALSRVGRGRFLAIYRSRWTLAPRFGEGFYGKESYTDDAGQPVAFHWMGRRATLLLPPGRADERMAFEMVVPRDALPAPPNFSLSVNGRVLRNGPLSCIVCPEEISLPATMLSADQWNLVALTTDEIFVPAERPGSSDTRELGLQIRKLSVVLDGAR
jgi:hypothetical protein